MATKLERTAYVVSNNLKTALAAKNAYPALVVGNAVYDGVGSDQHLIVAENQNGTFRTINVVGSTTSFDFINPADAQLVRFWNVEELAVMIAQVPGVSSSDGVLNIDTWTWTINYNGQNYTGTDTSKPDAIAKALIKVINAAPNFRLGG